MTTLAQKTPDLDPQTFKEIAALAYQECGLTLVKEKQSMVCSRLRHRLRALQLHDFGAYSSYLRSGEGSLERRHLISALTTNVSHFFREAHHFDILRACFQGKLSDLRAGGEMRIWSAGCSNGQEALSAAITLLEAAPDAARLNVRILGTDIDPEVVNFARNGRYPDRMMAGIPEALKQKHFLSDRDPSGSKCWRPVPALRQLVRFNELNLLGSWPMKRRFDVILCRNVVIYFDLQTQHRLWPRFHANLAPGGLLFLGHAERIADAVASGFQGAGPTTYLRLGESAFNPGAA